VHRKLETFARKVKRHGAGATAYEAAVRALGAVADFKVLRGVFVTHPEPAFLECPYDARLIDGQELHEFARDPANEMSRDFLDAALARGDQCYGIVDRGRLAAYGWYAFGPTPIGIPGMLLHFRRGYVYMYKGFTAKPYRGKRLHAIGMMLALNEYRNQGFKGLVAYVESNNFDSLKSCYRMGYKTCGRIRVLRLANRYFIHSGQGCTDYGLELQPNSLQPRVSPMSCGS
jgi:hypothetical protein